MRFLFTLILIWNTTFLLAQSRGGMRPQVVEKIEGQIVSCHKSPSMDSVEIICFIPGTNDTFRTVSDSAGNHAIKNLPSGDYTAVAKMPGYITSEFKGVIVSENKYTYLCFEMVPIKVAEVKRKKRIKKK